VAVHLNLVNAPNIIYSDDNNVCGASHTDPCTDANDPYTNGDTNTMLGQVGGDLRDKVGTANYDLGHVFGTAMKLAWPYWMPIGTSVAFLVCVAGRPGNGEGVKGTKDQEGVLEVSRR
jgi:hypothetical protein